MFLTKLDQRRMKTVSSVMQTLKDSIEKQITVKTLLVRVTSLTLRAVESMMMAVTMSKRTVPTTTEKTISSAASEGARNGWLREHSSRQQTKRSQARGERAQGERAQGLHADGRMLFGLRSAHTQTAGSSWCRPATPPRRGSHRDLRCGL